LLVRQAQEECLRLAIEKGESLIVSAKHFEVAVTKVMPSVTKQDEMRYNKLNKHFVVSRVREETNTENPVENKNQ